MRGVMNSIISPVQSGFIPGRNLSSNVLIASDLLAGYNRKNLGPRCMINMDLRKAYDTVEWPFLKAMLLDLGFPEVFSNWILECVSSVSYSILVNGLPLPPFKARRGLRQGDPLSPFLFAICMEYLSRSLSKLADYKGFEFHPKCKGLGLTHLLFADDLLLFSKGTLASLDGLMSVFSSFSAASGLHANLDKCAVFLGGVPFDLENLVLRFLGMKKGSLPFRYLGFPLSGRKPSNLQCSQLISRISSCLSHWTTKFLTYAGRLQLILSVCAGIKNFWGQTFLLPAQVSKQVEALCRSFLWSGSDSITRKAPIAWDRVCLPRMFGGLNIQNFSVWNSAALLKLLWALALEKSSLWVKWIHGMYIKNRDLMAVASPSGATWMIRRIFKHRDLLSSISGWERFSSNSGFSIQKAYLHLIGDLPKPPWRHLLSCNQGTPRSKFILWLICNGKLATQDRLNSWGLLGNVECVFGCGSDENHSHLFMDCPYSLDFQAAVLHKFECHRPGSSLDSELIRLASLARRKSKFVRTYIMVWTEWAYQVWLQRCRKKYQNVLYSKSQLINNVYFSVASRCDQECINFLLL